MEPGLPCLDVAGLISLPYTGAARVMDLNGSLLDVGWGEFVDAEHEGGTWKGTIRVFANSCLAAKSITSLVELADGTRVVGQVGPKVEDAPNGAVLVEATGLSGNRLT